MPSTEILNPSLAKLSLGTMTDKSGGLRVLIPIQLHGGHSKRHSDDGVFEPPIMTKEALNRGYYALGMGHNSLDTRHADAMRRNGLEPLVGFEARFCVEKLKSGQEDGELVVIAGKNDPYLVQKMSEFAHKWSDIFTRNRQISALDFWNYLRQQYTPDEISSLRFVQPHPSLTKQMPPFIRLVAQPLLGAKDITYGGMKLIPEMGASVDAVEIYNGASGIRANQYNAEEMAREYPGKPTLANPDSHHPLDIDTAANLTAVKLDAEGNITTEGIFKSIQEGYSIPVAGFSQEDGNWPLFRAQIALHVVKEGKTPPQKILWKFLATHRQPCTRETAKKLVKDHKPQTLFDSHNNNNHGWFYLDRKNGLHHTYINEERIKMDESIVEWVNS